MSESADGLANRAARAFDRLLPAYWPLLRMLWRWRWLVLRARTEVGARAVGSRVVFDVDRTARIGRHVTVDVLAGTQNRIVIGPRVRVGDDVFLQFDGGVLTVGAETLVRSGVRATVGGELNIGSGVMLGWGVSCHCAQRLTIGDDATIAERSVITDSRHLRTPPHVRAFDHVVAEATTIGANTWLGAHVVVGAGVTVHDGAFIGAGSVVTKDVPAGWLAVGVPAKAVRELEVEEPGD